MKQLPYKHTCQKCNTDFRSKGPNNKYCSKECKHQVYFENSKLYDCKVCNKKFQGSTNNQNKFCSKECYGSRMNTHPQEFSMAQRAEKMREGWDESSWKKSIQTRKDNGNIIDWDIAKWKQYWRRCNDLTRKIRATMLESWDGIDYIDGEYIRDNLTLHYTHGDYPTLDHLIPRSEGFKKGLTPYEITIPENLKWTKRKNNSKKYNKKQV
jgi:hypothetical protein